AITTLLQSQENTLFSLAAQPHQLAQFLFENLCSDVPEPIHLDQEIAKSKAFFNQQAQGSTGIWNMVAHFTGFGVQRIETLLKSDQFFEAIALLLPFHHWQALKQRFHSEPIPLTALATAIYRRMQHQETLDEQILLDEINLAFASNYQDTSLYAQTIGKQLKELSDPKTTNLTETQEATLATFIRNQCLPLMSVFIKEEKRDLLFNIEHTDTELCELFKKYFEGDASTSNAEDMSMMIYPLILNLCPSLNNDDQEHPEQYAAIQKNQCQSALSKRFFSLFLMSDVFKNILKKFFNENDYDILVATCFSNRAQVETFIDTMRLNETNLDHVPLGNWLDRMRANYVPIQDIRSLDERLRAFQTFIPTLSDPTVLDPQKVASFITTQMCPILTHPHLLACIDFFIGALRQKDIQLIFQAKKIANPEQAARDLLKLQTILHRQDWKLFEQEFIFNQTKFDIAHMPFNQTLEHFAILMQEVIDCQCYYNQHDPKGEYCASFNASLYSKISSSMRNIYVSFDDSFMGHFSRKIFFLQGLRNGFPKAGEVSRDANKNKISILQRINKHILNPLWWTINSSKFSYYLIKICKTVSSGIRDAYFALKNGMQFLILWLIGQGNSYKGSNKNLDNVDYYESAVACADIINELTPLNATQIAEKACPEDVIKCVEDIIDAQQKGTLSLRIFDNTRTDKKSISVNRRDATMNFTRQ
ncbi:MAG TPA: hypothetical protein VHD33_06580, partial [Legionellaceae bacterium]|nr:hypothetical protein [Legionellaceae bacterium]